MVEFKIFGIPVRVEMSFWFTLGLIGLIGSNVQSSNALLELALFVLAGFLSILIHELGHALMIKKYRLPTQIVLSSFGGYAMFPAGVLNRLQAFLVTAAGPALQILTAVLFWFTIKQVEMGDNMLTHFCLIFVAISIFWGLLNCLPIVPLDGGQMLASILGPKKTRTVYLISVITAIAIGAVAVYFRAPFGILLAGLFAYQNYKAWQQTKP
ncbi:metalloprotease [Rubritalea tangerina]|uniref:Metalloprotease n=1 Tax=Rubritalea tangerina TaxID=430798 RepID=A0ABW4Z777_9BACT